jgi:MFS family permease
VADYESHIEVYDIVQEDDLILDRYIKQIEAKTFIIWGDKDRFKDVSGAYFLGLDFRRFWPAALVSGTCLAAHNTAVFWALGKTDSALIISLMSTLSALPFAIFTLPAGALADMVDRKKILYATNLWQAAVAMTLMSLGLANLLSPYVILASALLLGLGFAFGSPASSSVEVQMVSKEQLASAYTLGGLQMNISGIIGLIVGGLLLPVAGPSLIFGANGLGFLVLFLAILSWKRAPTPSVGSSEDFLATISSTIRYVRYTPGIKIILRVSRSFHSSSRSFRR